MKNLHEELHKRMEKIRDAVKREQDKGYPIPKMAEMTDRELSILLTGVFYAGSNPEQAFEKLATVVFQELVKESLESILPADKLEETKIVVRQEKQSEEYTKLTEPRNERIIN